MEDKLEWRDKEEIDLIEKTEQLAKRIKSNHTLFFGYQNSLLEELRSTYHSWRAAYEKMKTVSIEPGPSLGIELFLKCEITDIIVLFALIFIQISIWKI